MAMIHLPADFKEFLRLLNAHSVEYLLIGERIKKPASLLAQRAHVEDLVMWSGGPLLCVARSYQ